jgi:hypothetical protein
VPGALTQTTAARPIRQLFPGRLGSRAAVLTKGADMPPLRATAGCTTGLAHMSPAAPDAVRLPWVPYDAQPYAPVARTCNTCHPDESCGWGWSGGLPLLRRTDWRNGTSRIAVASTRTQAMGWWADLLEGRAV